MEASYKRRNCRVIEQWKKMAFNNRYSDEERFHVNPRDLLFTQPDIKSTFTDPTHPSVRETASLIRRGELKPHEFGDLHVSIDEQGRLWCDNNRRLFAYREAGVDSVPVVFDGTRRPKTSLKVELSDPDFVPRIRGEASRVQIPLSPTSEREGYEMQKGSSLPGFVSGGYLGLDEEDEDEYGARFAQLGIRASCTESLSGASRVQKPPTPTPEQTPEQNAYQIGKKPSLPGFVSGGYLCLDEEEEDEFGSRFARLGIRSSCSESLGRASGVQILPTPTPEQNAHQRGEKTSFPGFVSGGYLSDEEGKDCLQKEACGDDERKEEFCISVFPCEDEEYDEGEEYEECVEDEEDEECVEDEEDIEVVEDEEDEEADEVEEEEDGQDEDEGNTEDCISAFSFEDEDDEVYSVSSFSVSSGSD